MRFSDIPRVILLAQYRVARLPVQLVEQQVLGRMDPESSARLAYERSVGALDVMVGRALGDVQLESRGESAIERSEKRSRAMMLDDLAARTERESADEVREKRDAAAAAPERAHAQGRQRVERVREGAARRKQEEAQSAAERTAKAKRLVGDASDQRDAALEQNRRLREATISAAEESADSVADARNRDAAAKRAEAQRQQARAERLEGLAESEKQQRRRASGRP
jgi:hypothetical protein